MTVDKTRQAKLVESKRNHHGCFPQLANQSSVLYATATAEFESWRDSKKATKSDTQQAQEDDQILSTVLCWVKNRKLPHRSVLQGQSRDIWDLWNNFDSLKLVNDILCRSYEDSSKSQRHLQQVVPTTLRPKILETIHSSTTAVHPGVTKTLEKLWARFDWPGRKKDLSVCLKLFCLSAT